MKQTTNNTATNIRNQTSVSSPVALKSVLLATVVLSMGAAAALTLALCTAYIGLGLALLGFVYVIAGVFAADAKGRQEFTHSFGDLAQRPIHFLSSHLTQWLLAVGVFVLCSVVVLLVQRSRTPKFAHSPVKNQAASSINTTAAIAVIASVAALYLGAHR